MAVTHIARTRIGGTVTSYCGRFVTYLLYTQPEDVPLMDQDSLPVCRACRREFNVARRALDQAHQAARSPQKPR